MQNKFGKYLKNQRKLKKVTQEVLASRLGVSTVYIHQLETAKVDAPSKDKCYKIANAYAMWYALLWTVGRQ